MCAKLYYMLLGILIFSHNALSVCTDGRVGIEIHIGTKTMASAYMFSDKQIPLGSGDSINVYEDYTDNIPGRKETLRYGYISTDGAGNFTFEAVSFVYSPPIHISIYHDHEVSPTEGMEGYYRNRKGQDFVLNTLRCDYADFIVEKKK